LITAVSSIMLCTSAFATENEIVVSDITIQDETTVTQGAVLVDILNVRSGPSTDTEIIGKLSLGNIVDVTVDNDGWYQIEFESKTAFIFAEYISIIDYSVTSESIAGSSIVEYAKKYIGTPYEYGGNTPSDHYAALIY